MRRPNLVSSLTLSAGAFDRLRVTFLLIVACLVLVSAFDSTSARAAVGTASRVLVSFDYEERRLGNNEDLPMRWVKVDGPGLPHYVNGGLSRERAFDGRYSFKLSLNGGSLIYRYPHGLIPATPGATYSITAHVLADQLSHARGRVTAYFVDEDSRPVKNSAAHSDIYAGRKVPVWDELSLELTAGPGARWLVLELELLQPSIWRPTALGNRALFEQDIQGAVYFDAIRIAQVPRIDLATDRPGNIFRLSDPLALRVTINDRINADLTGRLVVTDSVGKTVYQRSGQYTVAGLATQTTTATDQLTIAAVPAHVDEALDETQTHVPSRPSATNDQTAVVPLPDLAPGWYSASLAITSGQIDLGQTKISLIRLPDDADVLPPDPRFGVIATDLAEPGWLLLPTILPQLGAGRVKIAAWSDKGDLVGDRESAFIRLLSDLRHLQVRPTGCLLAPSPGVAKKIGDGGWFAFSRAPVEQWQPELAYMIARYAGYIDRWQIGGDLLTTRDNDEGSAARRPSLTDSNDTTSGVEGINRRPSTVQLKTAFDRIDSELHALIGGSDFAMPWPAWLDLAVDAPPSVALGVADEVLPRQVPLYLSDARSRGKRQVSLTLRPLSRQQYGRDAQLRDLVQRVVFSLSADADRIELPLPLRVTTVDDQARAEPDETFLVLRTLIRNLGRAKFKGRVPVTDGVDAFLFDRDGQGVIVLWRADDGEDDKSVKIVLGKQPRRVDLLGNISPVLKPSDDNGLVNFRVGREPFYITGIDAPLAQLRGSFTLDNRLLESSFKPHLRRLRFTNPYSVPISGRVRMIPPPGWSVVTQQQTFALLPGETYDAPVTIEFPYNSIAGERTVDLDLELRADENRRLKVPLSLRIGLGEVGLSTIALRDGEDLLVQQIITNYSDKPIDYNAFAVCPDQARQERLIIKLQPGETTIKKYRFKNVPEQKDLKVRTGLRETEGTRVLNDEVPVQ